MYSGNTFHGYAEMRVTLQNHSPTRAHEVRLVYPNQAWSSGNSIESLSRTVTLAPGARAVVPLWQPPLPANGDSSIRVEVDHRLAGNVHAPNADNHMDRYGREGLSVLFISRGLDSEAVERAFNANRGGFTAAMAVGAPDADSSGGYQPKAWMPDTRQFRNTNWLELDYATPQTVDKISIYNTQPPASLGSVTLIGTNGTNVASLPMSSGKSSSSGASWAMVFSFPATGQPVNKVRLNFDRTPPYSIGVDAVAISGPSGSAWASDARASSDNSAQSSSYTPPGASRQDVTESLRAELPVSEWSESWLAYTPFDGMALNAADFNGMPSGVLAAIGNYLQAGGNVFVFGQGDLPATWRSAQTNSLPDGVAFRVGLGTCFVSGAKGFARLDPKTLQFLRNAMNDTVRYWQSLPEDGNAANAAVPIVKNLKIPVRGIVFIMLAFVVLIGPVNIVVLNRRKRRTWMLWTIPAISFAITLLVFTYSLLREGITPDTRITGLTVLDQPAHHAATVGATAFYCPLTPNGGLRFDYETEATPLVHVGYSGSGSGREVDWTQTQQFRRGWVSARVPVYFHLRKSETRRERLEVEGEPGHWAAVNGLGAPIKSLWFADAGGKIYEAENVPAGQKANLLAVSGVAAAGASGAIGLFHEIGFAADKDFVGSNAKKYLMPGTYIAKLDGNPFIENALGPAASPKRTQAAAVVYGILGANEDTGGSK